MTQHEDGRSPSGTGGPRDTVAVFDFDGTLTQRDTLIPFVISVVGAPRVATTVARQSHRLLAMAAGRADRGAVKAAFLAATIGGRSIAELQTHAARFADEIVARRIRPEMAARVEWHRAQGHRLIVISASPALYVRPAVEQLGITETLATELEIDDDQRVTGRFVGDNVRGAEKIRLLRTLLGDTTPTLWAYGDSTGDRELLAAAKHAHFVGRRGVSGAFRRVPLSDA